MKIQQMTKKLVTISKLHFRKQDRILRQERVLSLERRPTLNGALKQQEIGSTVRITFDSLTLSLAETRHYPNDEEEVDPTVKIEYVAKHNKKSPYFYDAFEALNNFFDILL